MLTSLLYGEAKQSDIKFFLWRDYTVHPFALRLEPHKNRCCTTCSTLRIETMQWRSDKILLHKSAFCLRKSAMRSYIFACRKVSCVTVISFQEHQRIANFFCFFSPEAFVRFSHSLGIKATSTRVSRKVVETSLLFILVLIFLRVLSL